MKNKFIFLIQLSILLALSSCSQKNRFEIDLSKNKYDVTIHRFDIDLLKLDTTNFAKSLDGLYARYPQFFPAFIENVLEVPATDTAEVKRLVLNFLSDSTFSPVNKKETQTYADISDIEATVSNAYAYIHYYFPEVKLPEIYFFVSGFNRSVILNEKFIAFGTDMYLGSDYEMYKDMTYKYMTSTMDKKYLATDIVSTTLFRMFVMNSPENRLLDNMIFRGKVMYLLSVFMPDEKPEILMGYSTEQWEWSRKFEKQIWMSIIERKDLFSSDQLLVRKYMNEAPFTSPVSQESPGRLGTWLGWQIVESYMSKNTQIGLKELMNENNAQKILEDSGFKP